MTPKKFKINKVDIYLIVSVLLMILYTIVDKIILVKFGMSNDTLTTWFFRIFGLEIASCCIIKSLNIRNERKQSMDIDPIPMDSEGDGVG
jgi:hypothetical protein